MQSVFHAGETAVQKQAGVEQMARRVGNGIHAELPPIAQDFLAGLPFAVLGMTDAAGQVWAGLLRGEPGFLQAEDATTVRIHALPSPHDPLYAVLTAEATPSQNAGLLAVDLATRRRMRVNGTAEQDRPDGFILNVRQAYANCPKYIQRRELHPEADNTSENESAVQGEILSAAQQETIANADTFFIASANPESGADASHRGGNPGFVRVLDPATLRFPDYSGNTMFNTLGNIALNPNAGLLFVDFETGSTLQLTGQAAILWDAASAADFAGAERVVEFRVARVVEIRGAHRLNGELRDVSPFNPV